MDSPLVPAVVVGLAVFGRRAAVRARLDSPFSIETLMSTVAVGALAIGATAEACIVVPRFSVGDPLDGIAAARTRSATKAQTVLIPRPSA